LEAGSGTAARRPRCCNKNGPFGNPANIALSQLLEPRTGTAARNQTPTTKTSRLATLPTSDFLSFWKPEAGPPQEDRDVTKRTVWQPCQHRAFSAFGAQNWDRRKEPSSNDKNEPPGNPANIGLSQLLEAGSGTAARGPRCNKTDRLATRPTSRSLTFWSPELGPPQGTKFQRQKRVACQPCQHRTFSAFGSRKRDRRKETEM
jgi:hypothetical protein